MTYWIEIHGVDGWDATYTIEEARNEHQARRIALDWWNFDTNNQPVLAISTDGRRVGL